jgi:cytoskeletal protein RodZ
MLTRKLNESRCETIASVAIALFVGILVALWILQLLTSFHELTSRPSMPPDARADTLSS